MIDPLKFNEAQSVPELITDTNSTINDLFLIERRCDIQIPWPYRKYLRLVFYLHFCITLIGIAF